LIEERIVCPELSKEQRAMKKLILFVAIFACLFVLMPAPAEAADHTLQEWCEAYPAGRTWVDGDTCWVTSGASVGADYILIIEPTETLYIDTSEHFYNYGTIYNEGAIDANGQFYVHSNSALYNSGTFHNDRQFLNAGTLYNTGTFHNNGGFTNFISGGISGFIDNRGKFFNHAQLVNWGTIHNYRCPGEVGVITAIGSKVTHQLDATIEFFVGQACP
jgi:hypothetical protein